MKTRQLITGVIAALMLAGCSGSDDKKQQPQKQTDDQLPIVKVQAVYDEQVQHSGEYTATVEPFKTNNISSNSGSRIKRILVDVGSTVRAGQSVVILDDVNIAQQQIALANIKRDLDRAKELVRIGGGTQQAVDQLQTQYDANVRAIATMQENTVLTSPVSGVVTQRNYDPGDLPGAMPILVVEQQQPLKVIVAVNESDFPKIKSGMAVDVRLDTYGDEVFPGRVHLIHPTIDTNTRTFKVEVSIANRNNRIRSGMFARVTFNLGVKQSVVIPDLAVVKQVGSGVRFVYVYNPADQTVSFREVELGQRFENRFEVLSGLSSGMQVVTSGQSRLVDGAKVRLDK